MRNQAEVGGPRGTLVSACAWLYAGYAGVGAFAGAMAATLTDVAMPGSAIALACVAGVLGVFAWGRSLATIRGCEGVESAPSRDIQSAARVMAHF